MAEFASKFQKKYTVNTSTERAKSIFSDFEIRIACTENVKNWSRIDTQTINVILHPQTNQGVTLNPEYTTKFEWNGHTLNWFPAGNGNIKISGSAIFHAKDDNTTEIDYKDEVEISLNINRILAKVISPIVSYEMNKSVNVFLNKLLAKM